MKALTIENMYGQGNANMIALLAMAYTATLDLVRRGFCVLSVQLTGAKPTILIETSGRCGELNGVAMMWKKGPYGKEIKRVALVKDTQVMWVERGH